MKHTSDIMIRTREKRVGFLTEGIFTYSTLVVFLFHYLYHGEWMVSLGVALMASAIIGFGLRKGVGGVDWGRVRDMALSWIIILPVAGIFGLLFYMTFHFLLGD